MIAAGKEDIRQWFIRGVEQGHQFMLVVFDRMEMDDEPDSPYYADSVSEARETWRDVSSDVFCKVMEVYDLRADREEQLAEKRAWHMTARFQAPKSPFSEMPNIGKVTERLLIGAGFETPEQLEDAGAEEAFLRIRASSDPTACVRVLYGLQGAIEGVRDTELDAATKAGLLKFFRGLEG